MSPELPYETFWEKIKWPAAVDKKAWHDFDSDISEILKLILEGSVDTRLRIMSKIKVRYASQRFGYEEKKTKRKTVENRRVNKIKQCRVELKAI